MTKCQERKSAERECDNSPRQNREGKKPADSCVVTGPGEANMASTLIQHSKCSIKYYDMLGDNYTPLTLMRKIAKPASTPNPVQ